MTGLLCVIILNIPLLGFWGLFFIPLPTLCYRLKYGKRIGMLVPGVTLMIMALAVQSFTFDIFFIMELLLLGYMLGTYLEGNFSVEKTMLYTCGTVLVAVFFGTLIYASFKNFEISVMLTEFISNNLRLSMDFYKKVGVPDETVNLVSASLDIITYVLVRIIPALMTAATMFFTWTTILLAKPVVMRNKLPWPAFGRLNLWKAPDMLVWPVIASTLMVLLPGTMVSIIGLNGLIVLMTIYFFSGIAIISFYFEKKKFPSLVKFFLYSLIVLQQLLLVFVIGLGFFDMWFNFRRLKKTPQP